MTETELKNLLKTVAPPDEAARAAAHAHWAALAKPLGGLGQLETMVEAAAALTGDPAPDFTRRAVLVLCADNGVVAQGVSQTDASVTRAVLENLTAAAPASAVWRLRPIARSSLWTWALRVYLCPARWIVAWPQARGTLPKARL